MNARGALRAWLLTSLAALPAATSGCATDSGVAGTKPGAAVAAAADRTLSSANSKSTGASGSSEATNTSQAASTGGGSAGSDAAGGATTTAGAAGAPGAAAATAEPQAWSAHSASGAAAQGSALGTAGPADKSAPPNTITPRPAVTLSAEQRGALEGLVAELRTSQGTIVFDFLPEKAPGTVQNFIELARSGFYDGTPFHRVIPGLFAQGGDPTGTGDGGPGYFIRAEFNDEAHVRGTVSMARLRHPDSAGSQFFICLATLPYLDGGYTAFGHVLAGDDVLSRIEKLGRATPQGTPSETITLEKVLIRPRSPAERLTASRQP